MLPQVNATLTAIGQATAAEGDRDDWDTPGTEPAGAGASKWTGELAIYYRERVVRETGAELKTYTARTVWLQTSDYRDLALDTNDRITLVRDGETITGRAISIAVSELAGLPMGLASTRVELEPV